LVRKIAALWRELPEAEKKVSVPVVSFLTVV
jgi:hypothetical protein